MATLAEVLNKITCGAIAVYGTGLKGCIKQIKKTKRILFTQPGFVFDNSVEFNDAYIRTLQAQGKAIYIKGVLGVTDNGADDTLDTTEDGTEQVSELGKYKFLFQFKNGLNFHRSLSSLSGFGRWDVSFLGEDNSYLGTVFSDTMKGFTAGEVRVQRITMPSSAQSQREGLSIQLLERKELDEDYAHVEYVQGVTPNWRQLDGVNQGVAKFVAVPVALETTITVSFFLRDGSTPISGLAVGDMLLTKDGATEVPSNVVESATIPGQYTLTVAAIASNDAYTIRLFDNANNRSIIIDTENVLFQSNTASSQAI